MGDAIRLIGKGSKLACSIQKRLRVSANMGSLFKSTYVVGNVIKNNIDRYLINGEEFSWSQLGVDLLTIGLEVFAMKNAAKNLSNTFSTSSVTANSVAVGSSRPYERPKTRVEMINIIERGRSESRPIFAVDTATNRFASNVRNVSPIEGYYDVALHGTPTYAEFFGEPIDAYTLSYVIRNRSDYNPGTNVRLLSCSTGDTSGTGNCFAQILANELCVQVKAPTDILYVLPDGNYYIGASGKGEFRTFYPRK